MSHADDSRIRVSVIRADHSFGWEYQVFGEDGESILDESDSGGYTYETEAIALDEGRRFAREALAKFSAHG
jgi:hypothetical protein